LSDVKVELDPVRKRDQLVSAALWGAGVSWIVPMLGTMTALNATVLPSHRTEFLNRLYCRGQVALTGSRWRAVVDPAVDAATPYMFCQNHTNHFDHVSLYPATPHFKQGLELEKHFKIPVYGWFMKARGTIGVRSGKEGQTPEIMANMRNEIARGHSILAFPEGHRTTDGRVGPFRKGVFYLARDLGIPIVPVAVTGMYRVMRKGSWLIRPGHDVTVYVDAPIPTQGIPDSGIPELAEHVRSVISARVDAYWKGE
jgi:1-acyl-sn-glycerol-3-phosphate acyltransferase